MEFRLLKPGLMRSQRFSKTRIRLGETSTFESPIELRARNDRFAESMLHRIRSMTNAGIKPRIVGKRCCYERRLAFNGPGS